MKELKFIFNSGRKFIDRISRWRRLRYLLAALVLFFLLSSLTSRAPDLKIKDWERAKAAQLKGNILSMSFSDAVHGWVIVERKGVLFTPNGAKNWSLQWGERRGGQPYLLAKKLYLLDNDDGWVLGRSLVREGTGVYASYPVVLRTGDGGRNWQQAVLSQPEFRGMDLKDIFFIDEDNGWAVGEPAVILKTEDGGRNWQVKAKDMDLSRRPAKSGFVSVYFSGRDNGWVCGEDGTVLFSRDGGMNWSEQNCDGASDLRKILFIDDNNGWIAGNSVYHTDDGGKNWKAQLRGGEQGRSFSDVVFKDRSKGWAIRCDGSLFRTIDGGKTWDAECVFLGRTGGEAGTRGRAWHSFLNGLFSAVQDKALLTDRWMISAVNGNDPRIWVAGEKEGLFSYRPSGDTGVSGDISGKIISIILALVFAGLFFWIRYTVKKDPKLPGMLGKAVPIRMKLGWFGVGVSLVSLLIIVILSVVSFYLSLYMPNSFTFKMLVNYANPALSLIATIAVSVSFLASLVSLAVLKKDEYLDQQLNLSLLGIFFCALTLFAIRSWFMY